MEGRLLVSTNLSSLFPSGQVSCFALETSNGQAPLAVATTSDLNAEHASHASVLHTPTTGTVLLRVLHGGLILELISLSINVPPIRFIFPAHVLPAPALFLWEEDLHVLAVTAMGSLYRVVIPIGNKLWASYYGRHSYHEYTIQNLDRNVHSTIHIHGTHCVAIGLPNGSLLRLETEQMGGENSEEQWVESVSQHGSFLSSFTSFLPSLSGTSPGHHIISMATHSWPTDIGHVWTLSRDRTLRFWKARVGCVATKLITAGREPSPGFGSSANGVQPSVLLDAERQTLIRVFSSADDDIDEDAIYILVFIPSASSSNSGGYFQLLGTKFDQLQEIRTIECPQYTARCHLQDFMVMDHCLYTLWDDQGQSTVVYTILNVSSPYAATMWQRASYADEQTLSPSRLEELLLPKGSLSSKFLAAILQPGTFSPLTLRTAVDQYVEACLSLPGGNSVSPQLTASYATIGEKIAAVVGCTVNLLPDTNTGALQHAQYWNALKRDWEGFVARCREVERSARWPLVLGVSLDSASGNRTILVVERERTGCMASEDLPLSLQRVLTVGHPPPESIYDLLAILWNLRKDLGVQAMLSIEDRLVDILHQEIAFSIADIMQDQAKRLGFLDDEDSVENLGLLDSSLKSWAIGRLATVNDMDMAIRNIIDVIGGFDLEVKREEEEMDEVEMLVAEHPGPQTEWKRAITTSYTAVSVNARYDICLALMIVFFVLAEELESWDGSLLAEVFSLFRGISMLKYTVKQPAGDITNAARMFREDGSEDMAARLRSMQVSQNGTQFTPTYPLMHRILAQTVHEDITGLPGSVHRFLDASGLLQSVSPAQATSSEVLYCERFRVLGYADVAREMLAWLPRTPAVTYVLARLWLTAGRVDDAAQMFEKIAASFGTDASLYETEEEALASLLPGGQLFDSEFSFYIHVNALFKITSCVEHEITFSQLAISSAPPGIDTSAFWLIVIKGYTELGLYEDAYAALVSSPYEKQKRECIGPLVYRMCEEDAVEKMMTFNFAGFVDEVEEALSFKARNVDPRIRPYYSRILYTWYILRGDYRSAALVMYQRARRLEDYVDEPSSILELAAEQLEAYMVAMNSLSLLDKKSAWVVLPVLPEHGHEPRKRRRLTRHIPEEKYSPGKLDAEIVDLTDIQYDYALLSARVDLVKGNQAMLDSGEFFLPAESIVMRLSQSGRFNMAMATARSLNVDMTEIFSHLTNQCLKLSHNPGAVLEEDTSDWLITDKVSSWPGTHSDRAWRYLRQSLERHDSANTDYRYTKATLETILAFDRRISPPPWLINSLEAHHHEYLIRTCLRYEILEHAIEHTLSMMKKADKQLSREPPKNSSATWLPYALIDQVLAAAATLSDLSARGQVLRQELQTELTHRIKRMQQIKQF